MEKDICLKDKARKRLRLRRRSLINKVYWCIRLYPKVGVRKISPIMVIGWINSLEGNSCTCYSRLQVTDAFNKLGKEGLINKIERHGLSCFDLWVNAVDN